MSINQHDVVFIALNGLQSLDLFGPLEVFATAKEIAKAPYRTQIASFDDIPITTEAGTRILPDIVLNHDLDVDTLVFCGGCGPRTAELTPSQIGLLSHLCDKSERIVGICTGSFLMSKLEQAKGKELATHWQFTNALSQSNSSLKVNSDALYVNDGKLWSSAGVTAGIDLALELVSQDHGQAVATAVARQLVVYMRRTGSQKQFSEPLKLQSVNAGKIAPVLDWILDNLAEKITVEKLAEKVSLSPRQFTRIFTKTMGMPPAKYVEHIRLDQARIILSEGLHRIDQIAISVGYKNTDSFRRAFERKFNTCPTLYQKQFKS